MEIEFLHRDLTHEIIGAAMEVHSTLGPGFLEAVYQEALAIELIEREIPFETEKLLIIYYKSTRLSKFYKADFVFGNKVVLEIKALSALTGEHQAQLINQLKATGIKVGLLINFGSKSLEYKRLVW